MPAGFRVVGDSGLYQVDSTNYCMSVMAHGTLASSSGSTEPWLGADLYTITYVGESPIFALYMPEDAAAFLYQTTKSGSTWTATWCIMPPEGSGSINPANCHYFVLDRPAPISGAGQGVRAWNEAAQMIYTSEWKTVVPVQSFVSGHKYAAVGGTLSGLSRDLNVDMITIDLWVYSLAYYIQGFTCYSGGIGEGNLRWYSEFGEGFGGGESGSSYKGVNQVLIAFDVTEYI